MEIKMVFKRTLYALVVTAAIGLGGCEKPIKTKPFNKYIDLNGDGQEEVIAVEDVSSELSKALNVEWLRKHDIVVSMSIGNGRYKEVRIHYERLPSEISFKDMNGDGKKDILTIIDVGKRYLRPEFRDRELRVAYQQEDGSFSNPETIKTYKGKPLIRPNP